MFIVFILAILSTLIFNEVIFFITNLEVFKFTKLGISSRSLIIIKSSSLEPGQIHLLENLRFHSSELDNCSQFSQKLSFHADVYINDAFGTVHRSHASNVGVAELFEEKYYGLLMEKDVGIPVVLIRGYLLLFNAYKHVRTQ